MLPKSSTNNAFINQKLNIVDNTGYEILRYYSITKLTSYFQKLGQFFNANITIKYDHSTRVEQSDECVCVCVCVCV